MKVIGLWIFLFVLLLLYVNFARASSSVNATIQITVTNGTTPNGTTSENLTEQIVESGGGSRYIYFEIPQIEEPTKEIKKPSKIKEEDSIQKSERSSEILPIFELVNPQYLKKQIEKNKIYVISLLVAIIIFLSFYLRHLNKIQTKN